MTAGVMRTRFSTDKVAPHDRYEAWAARGWPHLPKLFETSPPEGRFFVRSEGYGFADISITRSHMTGLDYDRTPALARADGRDELGVLLVYEGGQASEAPGQSGRCGPRSVLLGDLSRTHAWRSLDSRAVTLLFPRGLAESVLPDVRELHGRVLGSAQARPIIDAVAALMPAIGTLDGAAGAPLARAMLHLVAMAAGRRPVADLRGDPAAGAVLRRAARERALAAIAAAAGDPAFDVGRAARTSGLSRSSLYRLLEEEGGVGAAIRRARVERLERMLADPADGRRLSEMIFAAGFADQTAAIRALRDARGMTPRDYRAMMLTQIVP